MLTGCSVSESPWALDRSENAEHVCAWRVKISTASGACSFWVMEENV